jgi:hypothetical protein
VTSLASVEDFFRLRSELPPQGQSVEDVMRAELALEAASEAVRGYCRRQFDYAERTTRLDGSGTDALPLPESPIVDLGEIAVFESTNGITESSTVVDNLIYQDTEAGLLLVNDHCWPIGRRNVEVTYSAGYLLPGDNATYDPAPTPVPEDLRAAVVMVAGRMFSEAVETSAAVSTSTSSGGTGDLVERQIGSYRERYETARESTATSTSTSASVLTSTEQRALERYKRREP